nr:methionine synthase [Micromonospora sp. DSM 115978]
VHCCASDAPVDLLRRAGVDFVGLDMARLSQADDDALGEAVEAGVALMAGVLPGVDSELSDVRRTVAPVKELWRRLGFPAESLSAVVVTPACGFAGASDGYVRAALRRCSEVARDLAESPE